MLQPRQADAKATLPNLDFTFHVIAVSNLGLGCEGEEPVAGG
jgi:hypothetical protein